MAAIKAGVSPRDNGVARILAFPKPEISAEINGVIVCDDGSELLVSVTAAGVTLTDPVRHREVKQTLSGAISALKASGSERISRDGH